MRSGGIVGPGRVRTAISRQPGCCSIGSQIRAPIGLDARTRPLADRAARGRRRKSKRVRCVRYGSACVRCGGRRHRGQPRCVRRVSSATCVPAFPQWIHAMITSSMSARPLLRAARACARALWRRLLLARPFPLSSPPDDATIFSFARSPDSGNALPVTKPGAAGSQRGRAKKERPGRAVSARGRA
jgi:hypothetical protein